MVKVRPSAMGLVPALIWKVNVVLKLAMLTRLLEKTLPAWPFCAGVIRATGVEVDAGAAAEVEIRPGEVAVHAQAGRAVVIGPQRDGQALADAGVTEAAAAPAQGGRPVRAEAGAEAVAGGEIEVARRVHAEAAARLPDARGAAVGRGVEDLWRRGQIARLVADDP